MSALGWIALFAFCAGLSWLLFRRWAPVLLNHGEPRTVTLTTSSVPRRYARIYRRRGMTVPQTTSRHPWGTLVPYRWRAFHHVYAEVFAYFWLPCILCKRPFGGHEIGDDIPEPVDFKGEGWGIGVCPACTASRNGGKP